MCKQGFPVRRGRAYVARVRTKLFFWPIAASLLSCPAVSAQNQRIALDYVAEPTCPTRPEFIAQVKARTALADFADDAALERRFSVSVSRKQELFVGRMSSPSGHLSTNERQVSSENCLDVVSALALIVALAVDPHADLTESPVRAADDETSPAASATNTATVPDHSERTALGAGAAFAAPQSGGPMAPGQVGLQTPGATDRTPSTTPAPGAVMPRVSRKASVEVPAWLLGAGIEGAFWPSSPSVLWGGMSLLLERQFLSRERLLPALRVNIAHSRSAAHQAGGGGARFTQNVAAVDACLVAIRWAAVTLHG